LFASVVKIFEPATAKAWTIAANLLEFILELQLTMSLNNPISFSSADAVSDVKTQQNSQEKQLTTFHLFIIMAPSRLPPAADYASDVTVPRLCMAQNPSDAE
jgi:hypothetical protein